MNKAVAPACKHGNIRCEECQEDYSRWYEWKVSSPPTNAGGKHQPQFCWNVPAELRTPNDKHCGDCVPTVAPDESGIGTKAWEIADQLASLFVNPASEIWRAAAEVQIRKFAEAYANHVRCTELDSHCSKAGCQYKEMRLQMLAQARDKEEAEKKVEHKEKEYAKLLTAFYRMADSKGAVELDAPRNNLPKHEPTQLLHILWTKAVGTKDYNKKEWLELESMINKLPTT